VDERQMRVIEIIRGTTHDGPGVRTTLFLKGCPLRCVWCQNPEGMNVEPEVWWESHKCIRCLACLDACPSDALSESAAGLRQDRQTCRRCGACVEACPSRAMAFNSQDWPIDALLKEALKDQDYYKAFGGGVTISGGEPLGQYRSVAELLRRLQETGVHTALDTCGLAPQAALAAVLPHTDHVLFDIKLLESGLHQAHTGRPNDAILANLDRIVDHIRNVNRAMKLWIRTPLIPGVTATPENILAISRFIHEDLPDVVERWELCAFNSACNSKYEKMGLSWPCADTPLMRQTEVDAIMKTALSTGMVDDKVLVSGLIAEGLPETLSTYPCSE